MSHEINRQLVKLLGIDLLRKCQKIAGCSAIYFTAPIKEKKMLDIEEAISEKKSNCFIVRLFKVNERSMRRYKAKSLTKGNR